MLKLKKAAVMAAAFAMVLALPIQLYAQQESNTSAATAGVIGNDVSGAITKWFSFVGWNDINGIKPSLGYAKNIGENLYLGAWYNGNIISIPNGEHTESVETSWDPITMTWTEKVTTTVFPDSSLPDGSVPMVTGSNQFEVLIGLKGMNMAIKAGFEQDLAFNKLDGNDDGIRGDVTLTDTRDGWLSYVNKPVEFNVSNTNTRAYLGWGGTFGSIMPYAQFDISFNGEKFIDNYSDYNTFNGSKTGTETINRAVGNSSGYVMPGFTLGAYYEFDKSDDGKWNRYLGLEYGINLKLYSNDYGSSGVSGTADGTASWSNVSTTVNRFANRTETNITNQEITVAEISDQEHKITPSFAMSAEVASGLKVGFSAKLPVTVNFVNTDNYTDSWTITDTKHLYSAQKHLDTKTTTRVHNVQDSTEDTTFTFSADIGIGASYQLVPERFSIHAGLTATPFLLTRTKERTVPKGTGQTITYTKTVVDGVTTVDTETATGGPLASTEDSTTVDTTWGEFEFKASAGFTFFFNPNAAIDMRIITSNAVGDLTLTDINVMLILHF